MMGGSGTRMWPLSRNQHPKQFIPFFGKDSLFQQTLSRVQSFNKEHFKDPLIVGNLDHKHFINKQLSERSIDTCAVILEPFQKNTAPALTLACIQAAKIYDENHYVLAMPADHLITDEDSFRESINRGLNAASDESIILFGIKPDSPHTGYGYIEMGSEEGGLFEAIRFTEKPDKVKAKKFIEEENFLWNGGIFLIKIKHFLALIKQEDNTIFGNCINSLNLGVETQGAIEIDKENFSKVNNVSIDHLIMEKVKDKNINAKVVPMDIGWSDLGSWSSFWDSFDKDADGNVLYGDAIPLDTRNSLLYSDDKTIASIGISDIVVINTPDAILIAHKDKTEEVKGLVEGVKANNSGLAMTPRKVTRPWGTYDTIDESNNFKVKRITVSPGHKLSKQSHESRSETWVIVSGQAIVTLDNHEFVLKKDESIFIPVGTIHRLENAELYPLELIEVQTGDYFGEDDITRYEDDYGRK